MSSPDLLSTFAFPQKPLPQAISVGDFSLPSPPLSVSSEIPADAFDLDSLVDLASTPQSSVLVSPKTAGVSPTSFSFDPAAFAAVDLAQQQQQQQLPPAGSDPADTLSKHHFERFLHYRNLAAQAQAELALCLVDSTQLMSSDEQSQDQSFKDPNMLASIQAPLMPSSHSSSSSGFWNPQMFSYQQQQQQQVINAQAQAQAHLQAAEVAQRMSIANYYMPSAPRASEMSQAQPSQMWSRTSATTSVSGASPPLPATPPNYSVPSAMPLPPSYSAVPIGGPSLPKQHTPVSDEEDELDIEDRCRSIPNMHGGGRGYVPGKTPDDPKKRHKCHVCGRGFARAFNLKSHVQTHDPLRPKPHQCPHPMCKRSFSRLHDLERHRQGIHSDGPLVDAKRQGVSPSVVRAQSRMQRRAETGGLI